MVGTALGDTPRAYPWPVLERERAVNDTLAGEPLVIFYREGALSALDAVRIAQSRPVGATTVWSRRVGDRVLTFVAASDVFRDRETGTTWMFLGRATAGPLAG